MNIFDKYTAAELRTIFKQKHWPEDFKNYIHEEIANELLDSWLESVDDDSYKERARSIVENLTYGYKDENGKEMMDFNI